MDAFRGETVVRQLESSSLPIGTGRPPQPPLVTLRAAMVMEEEEEGLWSPADVNIGLVCCWGAFGVQIVEGGAGGRVVLEELLMLDSVVVDCGMCWCATVNAAD